MLIECVCGCHFAAAQPACPQCSRTVEAIAAEKDAAGKSDTVPDTPEPAAVGTRTRATPSKKIDTSEPTEK
jgi:hypothetical protein